jgi:hypothetical protein
LIYAKAAPEILSPQELLVRADIAKRQVPRVPTTASGPLPGGGGDGSPGPAGPAPGAPGPSPTPPTPIKPRRFYGSVEIDISRPVKAFDTILNSGVMELQRSPGARVTLTREIEAEAPSGFNDAYACVVAPQHEAAEIHAGINRVLGLTSVELRFVSRSSALVRLPLRSSTRVDDRKGRRSATNQLAGRCRPPMAGPMSGISMLRTARNGQVGRGVQLARRARRHLQVLDGDVL